MSTYTINETVSSKSIPTTPALASEIDDVLQRLNIDLSQYGYRHEDISTHIGTRDTRVWLRTPITGESYASLDETTRETIEQSLEKASQYFDEYKRIPAPKRGEFVRILGNYLRQYKNELGFLVSVEAGKIVSEGLGEVQEMIDIADFAVGLSRQLYGRVIASERDQHSMRETWHPLGVTGVIAAFNFPVAVWAWNACIAFVCGNPVVFKPSDKCTLSAIACHELVRRAAQEIGINPEVSQIVLSGVEGAQALARDKRVALLSVTGSVAAGGALAPLVQERFGRTLLELGGNNAMIVAPSADLDFAVRAITFAAAGTAGQRCTTLRRVIVHRSVADELLDRIARAYSTLTIGNPLSHEVLVGPVIASQASDALEKSCEIAAGEGVILVDPQRVLIDEAPQAYYRRPGLIRVNQHLDIMHHETFAPLLYAVDYDELCDAIEMNNCVPQGLSSSIFTNDLKEAELFLSAEGSDCGIANVNIGPSGAEIGGAFGGEKHTGGGRESGSDAWKGYMRVQTSTINYGDSLPLAQGVEFI